MLIVSKTKWWDRAASHVKMVFVRLGRATGLDLWRT